MAVAGRTHTKLTGAPDYDSSEFWDAKFATGRDVGEWLNSGEILLEAVLSDLRRRPRFEGGSPRILHLGPGVSKLGVKLRDAYAERQWKGNGIVVSPKRRTPCFSVTTSNPGLFCRTWTSRPKPFALVKLPNVRILPNTRCVGYALTYSRGIMFPP